ncbi:MAG: hypothetical protein ACRDDH_09205 [Cetobacterium sp.]|uniref:hypothetical protein n=1 Tax=Cetobacterium sp. TaxID=2071632 RepID=UPI003EE426B3
MLLKICGRNISINSISEWAVKSSFCMQVKSTKFDIVVELTSGKDFKLKSFDNKEDAEVYLENLLTKVYGRDIVSVDLEKVVPKAKTK